MLFFTKEWLIDPEAHIGGEEQVERCSVAHITIWPYASHRLKYICHLPRVLKLKKYWEDYHIAKGSTFRISDLVRFAFWMTQTYLYLGRISSSLNL